MAYFCALLGRFHALQENDKFVNHPFVLPYVKQEVFGACLRRKECVNHRLIEWREASGGNMKKAICLALMVLKLSKQPELKITPHTCHVKTSG